MIINNKVNLGIFKNKPRNKLKSYVTVQKT